jgi:acetoin:2,6-dichlorophenolindophenol oxidoreductase subunit alpha
MHDEIVPGVAMVVDTRQCTEDRNDDRAALVEASRDIATRTPLLTSQLHEMLRRMLRIRLFEERAASLRAQLPGFLHNSIGQEAEIVGACMALREDDYMTGNHRSHGHPIGKGVELAPLMAELFGKKTGVCKGKGGSMHLAVFSAGSLGESGIVGSLMPVAVGAGLSARLRGTDQVCLCFFGDGAANCGPFHESLNLAAIWKLPVVFLCENNGYATFSSQSQTTAVPHIAQRGAAYGIPGVIVDGQDVLAVYHNVAAAVTRARCGSGPTLVEAKTYRYCEHAEFGDAFALPPYRTAYELASWRERDPIQLFSARLQNQRLLSIDELQALRATVLAEVAAAVQFAEESPAPEAHELFDDVFI